MAEIMRVLMRHGAPVHGCVLVAASNGCFRAARILVDMECDLEEVDNRDFNPLMLAVEGKHNNVARLLFESGSSVNAKSDGPKGETALELAIRLRNHEIVR